jgi:hypothetical protein
MLFGNCCTNSKSDSSFYRSKMALHLGLNSSFFSLCSFSAHNSTIQPVLNLMS